MLETDFGGLKVPGPAMTSSHVPGGNKEYQVIMRKENDFVIIDLTMSCWAILC